MIGSLIELGKFPAPSNICGTSRVLGSLGFQLHVLNASTDRELDTIFASSLRMQLGGFVIEADAFFTNRSEQLAALTLRHAIPAIYQFREFAAAGA
jgi:putative ABC transport system substrate-binding protein